MNLDLLAALSRVDPHDRELLIDNAVLGLSARELGFRDGIDHKTVLRRIDSARSRLAEDLAELRDVL